MLNRNLVVEWVRFYRAGNGDDDSETESTGILSVNVCQIESHDGRMWN